MASLHPYEKQCPLWVLVLCRQLVWLEHVVTVLFFHVCDYLYPFTQEAPKKRKYSKSFAFLGGHVGENTGIIRQKYKKQRQQERELDKLHINCKTAQPQDTAQSIQAVDRQELFLSFTQLLIFWYILLCKRQNTESGLF